jgi:DsbC/DsbD-like thiol-disulfide interchange protein
MTASTVIRLAALVLGLVAAAAPVLARSEAANRVNLSLISERTALVPGETAWLGIQFEIQDGWHIYWNGQNDAGAPPEITVELPPGFTKGDLQWPAPKRHLSDGPLLDHVYEKRVVLLLPVKPPADAAPGSSATVRVSASWMVCKSACELGSGDVSITLPIAERGKTDKAPGAAAIAQARERVPTPAQTDGSVVASAWKGSTLTLTSPKGKKLAFYPAEGSAKPVNLVKDGATEDGKLELRFEEPARVLGIVEITPAGGSAPVRSIVHFVDIAPPGVNPPKTGASDSTGSR